jgi:MFS family permease
LLLAWLIFLIAEPARRGRGGGAPQPIAETVRFMRERWRFFLGHFIGFGLQSLCAYAVISWQAMYLHRMFGWNLPFVATMLMFSSFLNIATGQPLVGYIADRWFRAGRKDAFLRLFVIFGTLQVLIVFCAAIAPNPWVSLFFFMCWGMVSNCTGPAAAAIQLVTPNRLRGQVSSAYILVFNLMGVGLGASIAGAFSTFLFKDGKMIGWSIFLTFLTVMPISIAFLIFAMRPMRQALETADV